MLPRQPREEGGTGRTSSGHRAPSVAWCAPWRRKSSKCKSSMSSQSSWCWTRREASPSKHQKLRLTKVLSISSSRLGRILPSTPRTWTTRRHNASFSSSQSQQMEESYQECLLVPRLSNGLPSGRPLAMPWKVLTGPTRGYTLFTSSERNWARRACSSSPYTLTSIQTSSYSTSSNWSRRWRRIRAVRLLLKRIGRRSYSRTSTRQWTQWKSWCR